MQHQVITFVDMEFFNKKVARLIGWKCKASNCDGIHYTHCETCGRPGHGQCHGNSVGAMPVRCNHTPPFSSEHSPASGWLLDQLAANKLMVSLEFDYDFGADKVSGWGCSIQGLQLSSFERSRAWAIVKAFTEFATVSPLHFARLLFKEFPEKF